MDFDYEKWLDQKLGKPVTWTFSASRKRISRHISEIEVKECIVYGTPIKTEQSRTGVKITKEKELHDPKYEALVVVYIDMQDQFRVISNHLRSRKRRI